jgi:predicted transcriptional regulator
MKTIQIRLPDHIHEKVKKLAEYENISLNNFVVSSISNEVVRQETREFFKKAASEFDRTAFADALSAVPDKPVPESDTI